MTQAKRKITVLPGDGIGPEVVDAALAIINATGVAVEFEKCEAGARGFQKGIPTGIPKETIESIERNRVVLKGQLETPIGHVPTADAIDRAGLDLSDDALRQLLRVDRAEWIDAVHGQHMFFEKFGARLPQGLKQELAALEKRLQAAAVGAGR